LGATLEAMAARAAEGLGVSEPIAAELYKLFGCDQGSFFVSHRDTEKSPGMRPPIVVAGPIASSAPRTTPATIGGRNNVNKTLKIWRCSKDNG
jgi:hypothetical protein